MRSSDLSVSNDLAVTGLHVPGEGERVGTRIGESPAQIDRAPSFAVWSAPALAVGATLLTVTESEAVVVALLPFEASVAVA